MKRLTLAASTFLLIFSAAAHGQSIARTNSSAKSSLAADDARRAVAQLKRLQENVIVYRSLGEFEEDGKLARVPLQTFERQLREVTIELEEIFERMPSGKLRNQLTNSLESYRDGAYWWSKIDSPRVIDVSLLSYVQRANSPADMALASTIPYTVAIHWRQASRYLAQAENTINQR